MRNRCYFLMLLALMLLQPGCKRDLVTVHLTVRNKTLAVLEEVRLEHEGTHLRHFGFLGADGLRWHGFCEVPGLMNVLTVRWKEDEMDRSAQIHPPEIPSGGKAVPEVVITYREHGWEITVGNEKPADW